MIPKTIPTTTDNLPVGVPPDNLCTSQEIEQRWRLSPDEVEEVLEWLADAGDHLHLLHLENSVLMTAVKWRYALHQAQRSAESSRCQ